MENYERIVVLLEDLGLTKNEVLVYLDLVKHHVCNAQEISQRAGIYRSNCYESLRRLVGRGLVSEVKRENTSYFQARDPEVLREIVEKQKDSLEEAISKIREIGKIFESRESASIYYGLAKLKSLFMTFAESGQEILTYNVPISIVEKIGEGFMDSFHEKRMESKTPLKIIYAAYNERVAKLSSLSSTKVKFLSNTGVSNTSVTIWGDYVYLFIIEGTVTIIEIKNRAVADTFRGQFEVLWENSRSY